MSKAVFILGAGASAHAGVPLMGEFLNRASELQPPRFEASDVADLQTVLSTRHALSTVYAKSHLDLDNFEDVFAAIDMGATLARLPSLGPKEIDSARDAIERLVVRTVEATCDFQLDLGYKPTATRDGGPGTHGSSAARLRPTLDYSAFARWIASLGSAAVITFNYDLALDHALTRDGIAIDYGLPARAPASSDGAGVPSLAERTVPLLKIHGSIHWLRCPQCQAINVLTPEELYERALVELATGEPRTAQVMPSRLSDRRCPECKAINKLRSVVVPPTWAKMAPDGPLQSVWRRAAAELSDANYLVFMGYSLPPTDLFFRYLFALGSAGESPVKRIWIANPDARVADRYRAILGRMVGGRTEFLHGPWGYFGNATRFLKLSGLSKDARETYAELARNKTTRDKFFAEAGSEIEPPRAWVDVG